MQQRQRADTGQLHQRERILERTVDQRPHVLRNPGVVDDKPDLKVLRLGRYPGVPVRARPFRRFGRVAVS